MSFAARMKCTEVRKTPEAEYLSFMPVYSSDPESPNYSWSKYTPSGELKLTVTNTSLWGTINPGDTYQLEFHKITETGKP